MVRFMVLQGIDLSRYYSALAFSKHGASGLVLHYFGDEATEREALELKGEIEKLGGGTRLLLVPGDIADSATSRKAS